MSTSNAPLAPYLEIAHARLRAWIGVDLRRGGLSRSVERHVETVVRAHEPSVAEWASRLDAPMSAEARALVEVATIPHSWLFRDEGQLDALARTLAERPRGRLHVLIAGCARGEDAYTVASIALRVGHDVSVLALDVNDSALRDARLGCFGDFQSKGIPHAAGEHFVKRPDGRVHATETLRSRVSFERRSLVDAIPSPRGAEAWDVIVCRNVLIYFDRDDAIGIVRRLGERLVRGGLLVLGASDVLAELPETLVPSSAHGRALLVRDVPARFARPPTPPQRPSGTFARPSPMRAPTPSNGSSSRALASDPKDALVAALDAGDLARARDLGTALMQGVPDAETTLLLGLAAFAGSRFDEAAARLRDVCRMAPGAWVAWVHLGLAEERRGRFADAAVAYARVPLATGEGEDLPRGSRELPWMLHATRGDLTRLALRRIATITEGGAKP